MDKEKFPLPRADTATERVAALVEEIIDIADRAAGKDGIVTAKLRIDARKWVVETCLLRSPPRNEPDADAPISVTIGLDAEDDPAP